MEHLLLGAALASRSSYNIIEEYINPSSYSRPFQILWEHIDDYYTRDPEATSVNKDIYLGIVRESTASPRHYDDFAAMIERALAEELSEPNVNQLVLQAKQKEVGEQLAAAIVSGKDTVELADKYAEILKKTDLSEAVDKGIEVFRDFDLEAILNNELSTEDSLTLYPLALGNKLECGLRPGDHVIIFARPETGKTALCLSISGGFCRQGAPGLYFGNEDRIQRLLLRQVSNLTGLTTGQVREDPRRAMELAKEAGIDNVTFVSISPGTPRDIEEYVEKYRPRWIIVDQMRNLYSKAENRTNHLESVATAMRNIGKKWGCVVISVTQAGDSASNKEILDMGDVDGSNTGIPAQADVMVGMGVTEALDRQGVRMLSLPKNKLGGDHTPVLVRISPSISRVISA